MIMRWANLRFFIVSKHDSFFGLGEQLCGGWVTGVSEWRIAG